MMNFKDWINKKYRDYLEMHGEYRSITDFAEWVGTTQQTMSSWMNGSRVPNRQNSIEKLISRYGLEVEDILGHQTPRIDYSPMSEAPEDVRRRFTAAISDANQRYRKAGERGEELSDEQADRVLMESLAKYGFNSNATIP